MSSSTLQTAIEQAVAAEQIPYVTAMIGRAGGTIWAGSAGYCAPDRLASIDTVFRIVSMSKAIGSTAALILAQRGKLDWDMPVEEVLPKFRQLKILDGCDASPPLRAPQVKATLRHLTTHTSGLAYEFWDPILGRYLQESGTPSVVSGTLAGLMYPLRFEPGERWQYGGGVDWLGMAVAEIDGRSTAQTTSPCSKIFGVPGSTCTCAAPISWTWASPILSTTARPSHHSSGSLPTPRASSATASRQTVGSPLLNES